MKLKIKCKICHFKCNDFQSLYHHLRGEHKLSTKDYYDKYLKTKDDGVCKYCGKQTSFKNLNKGYSEFCSTRCASIGTTDRKIKTCLKNRGTEFPTQSKNVRDKCKKTWKKNLGTDNPSKSLSVKHKKEKTCLKHFNVKHTFLSEVVKNKSKRTIKEKFNVEHPMKCSSVVDKLVKTNLSKRGVACVFQDEKVKRKIRNTCLRLYGFEHASENDDIKNKISKSNQSKETRDKIFSHKRKKHKGYLSNSEYEFSKLLDDKSVQYKAEFFVEHKDYCHHFDFAVYYKGKINCLVEIDGRYYHGLYRDFNGGHIKDSKDYLRWSIVPKNVKLLVIDDNKLKEGFEELLRILPMKYKKWKKEMIHSIPKRIEEAIPKFTNSRMLSDWKCLCEYDYSNGAFLGKSILLNFCHSHWDNFNWKFVRKTLYKSPCSSHHLLEGLDSFKNVSILRRKYKKKYKGIKEVIVKYHSPEKMLAICSLGKTYISKEPIDKESIRIIKFLNLKAYDYVKYDNK